MDSARTPMRTISALVVLLLVAAAPGRATTIVPADLGELSRDAVAIARGRVADVRSQWTEDRGTVETIVTLEVESYLKGTLGAFVRFRVPGGELGRYRTIVVGAPDFVGFNQGVFRVIRAADDSGGVVTPPLGAAGPVAVRIVRGDAARRPLP